MRNVFWIVRQACLLRVLGPWKGNILMYYTQCAGNISLWKSTHNDGLPVSKKRSLTSERR